VDEKEWIDTDGVDEEARWENVELLLSQVTPDIEERDMLDALLLAKAAGVPTNSLEKALDLWGQAIEIAFRQDPKPDETEFWVTKGVSCVRQQLANRLGDLNLDPDLINDPIGAITTVYGYHSPLYKKYPLEAFRVSQLFYYSSLVNIWKFDEEERDDIRAYAVSSGVKAVEFAYFAEHYRQCIELAQIAVVVFEKISRQWWLNSQLEEIYQDLRNGMYWICYNAARAKMELRAFPEALEWAIRAEPYVSSLEKAHMRSFYWTKRGEILIELGKAEEALELYEKATKEQGLTPREIMDAKRQLEFAKGRITGDIRTDFPAALHLSNDDIERLNQIVEAATTGNLEPEDLSEAVELIEKYLSPDSLKRLAKNTALERIPSVLNELKQTRLLVFFARAAVQRGDFSKVEKLLPGIKQLAESNSPAQLNAAFFLVRYRQYQGEPVTWESISPLVSRLFDLPQTLILDYLLDLSAILFTLDEQELVKAVPSIKALLKEITFDNEDHQTPTAVVQGTAFSMTITDAFLTLLVRTAILDPDNADWWLKHVSRFKYLSSYRGQRLQKGSELFRFFSELPEDSNRILKLAESLAQDSLETKGVGSTSRKEKEVELMTLLYPLYSTFRPSQKDKEPETLYPEIIHIETANFFDMEGRESPVMNVAFGDGNWGAYVPEVEIDKSYVPRYLKLLEASGALRIEDKVMIEIGLKLRKALLPIPQHKGLFSFTSVRSTGVYHKIPLDSLPLLVDEETAKVTHWVGEQITSVLLTGLNKDLAALEKPLSINNIAIFANSTFKYSLRSLPGVVKEIGAIEETVKTTTGVSLELYRESDSNRETFLRLSGKNAPHVLHIASHGIISEESPSASFIALSDKNSEGDSILGAVGYFDIMLMDLRQCDLVVLSACSTHEGKSIIGEGIMGLAWAFKAAGAKVVIGTRWPVSDAVAVAFWRKFYENVCGGFPIGKAFQGARTHIMKQEKWNHPYYWGVFQLIV
jgi:tetratricopeptide (TPR) repeat protein